ncbi:MAG: hypothetical protein OCU22_03780 [Canidatus Methanoxibalbensis ujae]|nr:hypothetical protein [Candidatus Methanoxibalbensis ujae]
MPRVRCEVCGKIARTLYVRVSEKHEFDENNYKIKTKWVAVGYFCEHCQTAKIYGKLMTEVLFIRRR